MSLLHLGDGVPAEPGGAGGHQVWLQPLPLRLPLLRAVRAVLLPRRFPGTRLLLLLLPLQARQQRWRRLHRRFGHQHALRPLALHQAGGDSRVSTGPAPGLAGALSDARPLLPDPQPLRRLLSKRTAGSRAKHETAQRQQAAARACEMSTAVAASMALRLGCSTRCLVTPSATASPAPA